MKRLLWIVLLMTIALSIWMLVQARPNGDTGSFETRRTGPNKRFASERPPTRVSAGGQRESLPPLEQRRGMPFEQRLRLLEGFGAVPEDADNTDWQLAQKTTWWGRPVNPTQFWSGRVVWLDRPAKEAANRKGRGNPPMPYEDPNLPRYPEDDGIRWNTYQVEGPNIHFAGSSKETAFWDQFYKTHPHPPEDLEREQFILAESILESRFRYHQEGNPAGTNSDGLTRGEVAKRHRTQRLGTPQEALTDDALFWSYTLKKRQEYEKTIAPLVGVNDHIVTNWVTRLFVDPQYVTQPLTSEQLKAADAWKFTYLKRLRSERTNESYIDAYLKAWNLSATEVFGINGR